VRLLSCLVAPPLIVMFRAKMAADLATPSNTPVSVTQTLSALRLTHARLLEEHGVNVALLRQREADVGEAELRTVELVDAVDNLEAEVRELKSQVGRREQRAILAEREVGFLQALMVRHFVFLTGGIQFQHGWCRRASRLKRRLKNETVIRLSRKSMKPSYNNCKS
jgi:hypothetical protein